MDDKSTGQGLLTAGEVAERLRLPLSTVYYLANEGKLSGFRVGRSWRFPVSELERMQKAGMPMVLVVDDHPPTRRLVVMSLSARGCQVVEAGSVDDALQLARHTRFDVLFVDVKMPGRDGTELIRELNGEYALDQMILISALPDLASADSLVGIGGVTLLAKPLSSDVLAACVEKVTGVRLPGGSGGSRA